MIPCVHVHQETSPLCEANGTCRKCKVYVCAFAHKNVLPAILCFFHPPWDYCSERVVGTPKLGVPTFSEEECWDITVPCLYVPVLGLRCTQVPPEAQPRPGHKQVSLPSHGSQPHFCSSSSLPSPLWWTEWIGEELEHPLHLCQDVKQALVTPASWSLLGELLAQSEASSCMGQGVACWSREELRRCVYQESAK